MAKVLHKQVMPTVRAGEGFIPTKFEQDSTEMSLTELAAKVNEGFDLDRDIKSKSTKLDKIKAELLEEAKTRKERILQGTDGRFVSVGDTKSSIIKVADFRKLLEKIQKSKLFDVLVNVRLTDAKNALGADTLNPITKLEVKEFNSVSFKLEK